MSDHDHIVQDFLGFVALLFVAAALIHAPCPPNSGLAWVWMWPPYQCVQVIQ